MASKNFVKVTTVDGTTENEKLSITGPIDVNDGDMLGQLFSVVDNLSNGKLSNPLEKGGMGTTKEDFIARVLSVVENEGKYQVNLTII